VDQTSASWNQIATWLRQLAAEQRSETQPDRFTGYHRFLAPDGYPRSLRPGER
jgi:hypothetical protein